jgi:DNA-binding PadR family transcriptional regulator
MTHSYASAAPGPLGGRRCHHHFSADGPSWRELRHAVRIARMAKGGGHGPGHGPGPGFGPGFGGFAPGFEPPFGPFGRHRRQGRGGPRARRGDVRAALLMLLAEEPRNGYGLMQEIERRSDGLWRPSPGSVYPALSQLEDEGLVRGDASEGGAGRTYSLTDAGRAEVAARDPERPAPWAFPGDELGDGVQQLRAIAGQLMAATYQVAQAGSDAQVARARDALADTRRALYRILAGDQEDDAGEAAGDEPSTGA